MYPGLFYLIHYLTDDLPPESLKLSDAYHVRAKKLKFDRKNKKNFLSIKLWRCELGVWRFGGFLKRMELAPGGFVTNEATQFICLPIHLLPFSPIQATPPLKGG